MQFLVIVIADFQSSCNILLPIFIAQYIENFCYCENKHKQVPPLGYFHGEPSEKQSCNVYIDSS